MNKTKNFCLLNSIKTNEKRKAFDVDFNFIIVRKFLNKINIAKSDGEKDVDEICA